MKNDKFEDYNQKGSIKESLNIKKEENNSPFSDSFVFKKEENKITWTNNSSVSGKEINSNETKINTQKEEKQETNQKDIEKVSQATSKVSTIASTTAAVVTTAAVAVVGIDLVTKELVDDLPKICAISEVISTHSSISFILNIGDNQQEAYNPEPGKECNLVVELQCESYDETKEIPVRNYGEISGEFLGLREETNYSINVYQPSFLYIERTYILSEPIEASTKRGQHNSISFEIETNPFGDDVYYATVNYEDTLGIHLYDYNLAVSNEDPETEQVERLGWAMLDSENPFKRQRISWSSFYGVDSEPYFTLVATTDDATYIETHMDSEISGGGRTPDTMEVRLFSQRINIENIERPDMVYTQNELFLRRVSTESDAETYYEMYFASDKPTGTYEFLQISATNVETSEAIAIYDKGETTQAYKSMNTTYQLDIDFGSASAYDKYKFTVNGLSHVQEDVDEWNTTHPDTGSGPKTAEAGVEVTILEQVIDFNYINDHVVQTEPSVVGTNFTVISTYHNASKFAVAIEAEDPGSHIQSYSLDINGYEYPLEPYNVELQEDDDNKYFEVVGAEQYIESEETISYVLYAQSNYNQPYNRTEKVEMVSGSEDLSTVDNTYVNGCVELNYVSNGDGYTLNITVHYEGTRYSSFIVIIYDLDYNYVKYGDPDSPSEAYFDSLENGVMQSTALPELQGNYIVSVLGYNGSNEPIFEETIDFGEIQRSV